MNLSDFSTGFDLLLNSYVTKAGFGSTDNPSSIELDEFEKSQFLTNAQEKIVEGLYNGRNPWGESFEETEELRRYLGSLVKDAELTPVTTSSGAVLGVDSKSKFFTLPDDLWFITYESVDITREGCEGNNTLEVYPVRQDEYHKIKKNPFRGANNRRALRLDLSENNVEIICKFQVDKYYVRYLRRLKPIILTQLDIDSPIQGCYTPQECEVHESLHQKILELAVQMALQSRGYSINRDK
jgi:hypothetical protein